jgi:hypothetical protein
MSPSRPGSWHTCPDLGRLPDTRQVVAKSRPPTQAGSLVIQPWSPASPPGLVRRGRPDGQNSGIDHGAPGPAQLVRAICRNRELDFLAAPPAGHHEPSQIERRGRCPSHLHSRLTCPEVVPIPGSIRIGHSSPEISMASPRTIRAIKPLSDSHCGHPYGCLSRTATLVRNVTSWARISRRSSTCCRCLDQTRPPRTLSPRAANMRYPRQSHRGR